VENEPRQDRSFDQLIGQSCRNAKKNIQAMAAIRSGEALMKE